MKGMIVRRGSRLAVTLPPELTERLQFQAGDEVALSMDARTGVIAVRGGLRYAEGGKVTRRFKESSNELLRRRARLYRALAK